MGKKQRHEVPNPNSVANRDIIQRLNFLYQSSVYLGSLPTSSSNKQYDRRTQDPNEYTTEHPYKRRKTTSTKDLSRTYIDHMRIVGQKTIVKIDPAVKRTLCNNCNIVLIPSSTVSFRVKKSSSHGHVLSYTCLECKAHRQIPAPPTKSEPMADMQTETGNTPPEMAEKQAGISKGKDGGRKRRQGGRKPLKLLTAKEDAGHIVYSGNKKLHNEDGNGLFIL